MGTIYTGTGTDSDNVYLNGYLTNLPTWPRTDSTETDNFGEAVWGTNRATAGGSSVQSLYFSPDIATVTEETIVSHSQSTFRFNQPMYFQDNVGLVTRIRIASNTAGTLFVQATPTNGDPLAAFTNSQVRYCGAGRKNKSLGVFCFADKDNYYFSYSCLLDNPLYASTYVRQCFSLYRAKNTANSLNESLTVNPAGVDSTTNNLVLTSGGANYSFVCSATDSNYPSETHDTGNWVTDLAVRQSSDSNAIGTCSNLVLARGTMFEVGETYSAIPGQEPDGNSDNNLFICCADWGSDRLMMRIKDLR